MPFIRSAPPAETDPPRAAALSIAEFAKLAASGDAPARERAFAGLVRHGGEDAVAALVKLIGSEDASVRNAAIEALAAIGPAAIDGLRPLFEHADPNLRIFALTALAGVANAGAEAAALALAVALGDPNVNVVAAAVEAVAASGAPAMAADLARVSARFPHHPFVGFAVRATLRKIG